MVLYSVDGFRQSAAILRSGTSDVSSVTTGSCEIQGTARQSDDRTFDAPFTGERVVVAASGVTNLTSVL